EVTAVDTGSRFVVYRNRLEMETDLFVGRREDTLRRVGGQWKIARRVILLEQNVLLAKNLTGFFGWPSWTWPRCKSDPRSACRTRPWRRSRSIPKTACGCSAASCQRLRIHLASGTRT